MRKSPLIALPILLLAGCTIATPEPMPQSFPPTTVSSESTAPSSTSSPTPDALTTDQTTMAALTCTAPTPEVMDWLRQFGSSDLNETQVTMVQIGEGNIPNEDWWIVAATSTNESTPERQFFLTNAPSIEKPSGEKWISGEGGIHWPDVDWPQDKLVAGREAQRQAQTCLTTASDQ